MGSDIKITKKVGVKNQDAPITTDASNINFKGAGVNATVVGNEVTVTIAGGGGGGSQSLQEVTDIGNTTTNDIQFGTGKGVLLTNGSRLREGTIDAGYGGSKGVAQICAVGYELKWEAGRLYVMDGNGVLIRHSLYNFTTLPSATDDSSKGYYVGSLWTLDDGVSYICTDSTLATATWDIYEATPQVNSDWNATSGVAQILNKPTSIPTANVAHAVKYAEALTIGQAVYVSSADGTNMIVSKADNSTEATSSKTLGLVTASGAANYQGEVITEGLLAGLNTAAATVGDAVWLGTAGNLIFWHYGLTTKPVAPAHLVFIGVVTRVNVNNGEIFVKPQNGFEIDELHDVSVVGRANNTLLGYNSVTGLHEFKTVSNWLGYVPAASVDSDIFALKPNYTFRGIVLNNNSTTIGLEGGVTMSTSASILAQAVINTTFASKHVKARYYGATVSAGRYAGTRGTSQLWFLGAGFLYTCDFNISDTVYGATCQQFYGMQGSVQDLAYGGASVIAVSTIVNCIGVGSDAADTNLQIFHNDAAGACTKVDLGVDFPANRTAGAISTTVYSILIYNAPSSTDVHVRVTNAETGATVDTTISTNLPATSLGLNFYASRAMGIGATNTGQFDLSKLGVYSIL